jgi:hypothetical protein
MKAEIRGLLFITIAYAMATGGAVISLANQNNSWWWYGLFIMFSSLVFGTLSEQQTSGETPTEVKKNV